MTYYNYKLEKEEPFYQRQIDLEKNPPLENFEYNLGIESKRLENQRLIGSRFFDTIEGTVGSGLDWLKQQAQDDPDRYTDDMLRLLGGGLQNTAWAISKLPLINEIAKGEDWLAEQARGMSEHLTPFLDPRFAGWGTRIATGILTDKGIGKAVKGVRYVNKAGITGLINRLPAKKVYANLDRFTWRDIPGNELWKGGQPDPRVTSKVDSLLGMMDDWRLSHEHLDKPMTGFVKNYGRKPTFGKMVRSGV